MRLAAFIHDENAQATTEYILILSVIVMIAILLVRDLIQPVLTRMNAALTQAIEKMFNPATMHRSPFTK